MIEKVGVYCRLSNEDRDKVNKNDDSDSIVNQRSMCVKYAVSRNWDVVDIYVDDDFSGAGTYRPEFERLKEDIKSKKIDKLVAIKVDRLTRNNYDGFWLLNYCEEHDVKIELILEPYDVSTANGEMIFGMNLVFGQRERKEIGARTIRAMEDMSLE